MTAQDTRDPAAPLPVASQATIPHAAPPPWVWPPAYQPPPPTAPHVDLRKHAPWMEMLKLAYSTVQVIVVVGGVIYGAGLLVGEFRAFKTEVKAQIASQDLRVNKNADEATKAISATNLRLDELNRKLERVNITRRNRPPRREPDEP